MNALFKQASVALTALLFCVSCTTEKANYTLIADFPTTDSLFHEPISMGEKPSCVVALALFEEALVTLDIQSEQFFALYELPSYSLVGRFVGKGQAGNEELFINPYIQRHKGNEVMYGNFTQVRTVTYDAATQQMAIKTMAELLDEAMELQQIFRVGDKIIGVKMFGEAEAEFMAYDMQTGLLEEFGPAFPQVAEAVPATHNNPLFMKCTTVKSDHSAFASVYDKFPILRIYSATGEVTADVRLDNHQPFPSVMLEEYPSADKLNAVVNNYRMIKSTDRYIYALYMGKTNAEVSGGINDFSNEIQVWDWQGNPIKRIVLDKDIFTFDVSHNDDFLICSSVENLEELYRYALK